MQWLSNISVRRPVFASVIILVLVVVGIVGYRIQPDQVRVRRSTVARAARRLRRQRDSEDFQRHLVATFAHWTFADSWRLKQRTLDRLGLRWW